MIDKVRSFIREYDMLNEGDRVVAGVSGGADSVALLKVLATLSEKMPLSVFVVHVNHGIRSEAGLDADYVRKLCEQMNIPFFLFEENIPKLAAKEKCSEEEMGRIYRYKCFERVMKEQNANKLAVAHHMDDQAETVLFHMIRGTDLAGLGGMRPVSGNIIRPLLCVRKSEICDWLTSQNISWQEDVTNTDDTYTRNRIRVNVIPQLSNINDKAVAHIYELAGRMQEYDTFIKRQADLYITAGIAEGYIKQEADATGVNSCVKIARDHLSRQDKILTERVLYELLTDVCGAKKDITGVHINDLFKLMEKISGRSIDLPYNVRAYNSYDYLVIERVREADKKELDVTVNAADLEGFLTGLSKEDGASGIRIKLAGKGELVLGITDDKEQISESLKNLQKNYTKYFDCDTIGNTLQIRYPDEQDYLVVDTKGHRKKIGKFFKDVKLPARLRNTTPLLAAGHEVLWVIGDRRSEGFKVTQDTKRILVAQYIPND